MNYAVTISALDKARLLNLLTTFPRETYRGLGRAGAAIRAKMRELMRSAGGSEGVEKFRPHSEWTIALHGDDRKLGGKLAESSAIQMYRNNKAALSIGFISKLALWAEMFQEKEDRATTVDERRRLHRLGFKNVPQTYNRPARDLVDPFATHYNSDFVKWAIRNTEKILFQAGK